MRHSLSSEIVGVFGGRKCSVADCDADRFGRARRRLGRTIRFFFRRQGHVVTLEKGTTANRSDRVLLGPFTAPVCFCEDIETGLRYGFRLVKMTILGIGLVICGLTLVCASAVFPWIVGRERSSQEPFEESLKRLDHHVRDEQRTPRDLDDKSEPAEHVPEDRDHRD